MSELIERPSGEITAGDLRAQAGQAANRAAARAAFMDYASRKAQNTLRRQAADLVIFAMFLESVGVPAGDLKEDPEAWRGITWGLVKAFQQWMLQQEFAIATCNQRLSTVKIYARLATEAGVLSESDMAMIAQVHGYSYKEVKHVDEKRLASGSATRRSTNRLGHRTAKKAEWVSLTREQARALKAQPDTPQGRRDALLMCLLLDHGMRCGEVAILQVENFNLKTGELRFYRPKVTKEQIHRLSKDTLRAARAYLNQDRIWASGPLLLGSRKNGELDRDAVMSNRAITKRVAILGEAIEIQGLSAHDCRHYWATQASKKTPIDRLKEAGGWDSVDMPLRYITHSRIANEGVDLGEDEDSE